MSHLRKKEIEVELGKLSQEAEMAVALVPKDYFSVQSDKAKKLKKTSNVLIAMGALRGGDMDDSDEDEKGFEDDEKNTYEKEEEEMRIVSAYRAMRRQCHFDNTGYLITVYLGLAVAWRKNIFNW